MTDLSYGGISATFQSTKLPVEQGAFHVEWLLPEKLAIGRDSDGRHAVFLIGDPLVASSTTVARGMRHRSWTSTTTEELRANLLLLPFGDRFRAAGTAIAVELIRSGLAHRALADVYTEVEGFIALMIQRILLPPEAVLGLVGELIVLEKFLQAMLDEKRSPANPSSVWRGWRRQSRDIVFGRVVIEVKATSSDVSRHYIHGLDQVEPRSLDGGVVESLHLASLGLRPSAVRGPLSVSSLVQRILDRLGSPCSPGLEMSEEQNAFLDQVSEYGPEDSVGYDHRQMRDLDPYALGYTTTFAPRIYAMRDANLRILRSEDLDGTYVLKEGLQYQIELPEQVPGSPANPRHDIVQAIRELITMFD